MGDSEVRALPPRDAVRRSSPSPSPPPASFSSRPLISADPPLFSRLSSPPLPSSSRSQDRQLISVREFGPDFKGRLIQVLWPETNTWYNAKVLKVNVKAKTATLYYVDSNEREDIDLYTAMLNMEVSWPLRGSKVGKAPAKRSASRSDDDSASESDEDVPLSKRAKPDVPAAAAAAAPKPKPKPKPKPSASRGAPPSENAIKHVLSKVTEAMRVAAEERDRRGLESTESGEKNLAERRAAADPDPEALAIAIESSLRAAWPGDYNTKARSVTFNLGDKSNPDLRRAVLDGVIAPEQLVLMSPADLARKDLREMRRAREERIGEDAFVSGETGDVRVVKTAKGEEVVKVGGGEELVEVGDGLGNRGGARAESQSQSEPPFRAAEDDVAEPAPPPARKSAPRRVSFPEEEDATEAEPPASASPDGSSPAREGDEGPGPGGGDDDGDAEAAEAPAAMPSFEAFAADASSESDEEAAEDASREESDGEDRTPRAAAAEEEEEDPDPAAGTAHAEEPPEVAAAAAAAAAEGKPREEDENDGEEYDPTKVFDEDDERAAGADAEAARSAPRSSSGGAPWRGAVTLKGLGASRWRATVVGGERASLPDLLPPGFQIEGRVRFGETEKFLRDVHDRSKTRGLTVAVATPEGKTAAEAKTAAALTKTYAQKERAGLAKDKEGEWEVYLVPKGKLATKLVRLFVVDAAAAEEKTGRPGAMLWCVVHRKGAGPDAEKPPPAEKPRDVAPRPAPVPAYANTAYAAPAPAPGFLEVPAPPAVTMTVPPPPMTAAPPPMTVPPPPPVAHRGPPPSAAPPPATSPPSDRFCEVCDCKVPVGGMEIHLAGKKHRENARGAGPGPSAGPRGDGERGEADAFLAAQFGAPPPMTFAANVPPPPPAGPSGPSGPSGPLTRVPPPPARFDDRRGFDDRFDDRRFDEARDRDAGRGEFDFRNHAGGGAGREPPYRGSPRAPGGGYPPGGYY